MLIGTAGPALWVSYRFLDLGLRASRNQGHSLSLFCWYLQPVPELSEWAHRPPHTASFRGFCISSCSKERVVYSKDSSTEKFSSLASCRDISGPTLRRSTFIILNRWLFVTFFLSRQPLVNLTDWRTMSAYNPLFFILFFTPTAHGFPRWSPIQVLTRPDPA